MIKIIFNLIYTLKYLTIKYFKIRKVIIHIKYYVQYTYKKEGQEKQRTNRQILILYK